jgi:hypothetical protein
MANQFKSGDFVQADFLDNVGGLNNTDTVFRITDSQAIQATNYDYIATGGFRKRPGHTKLNSSAAAVTRTTGTFVHKTLTNIKTLLRTTPTILQSIDETTGAQTQVMSDAASTTDAFTSNIPTNFTQFNSPTKSLTWIAGGGQASGTLLGYDGTKYTPNGAEPLTGYITPSAAGTTGSLTAGNYYYAIVAYKGLTGVTSNAALDVLYASAGTNNCLVAPFLNAYDTSRYTQYWLYRSSVGGSSGFTAGSLIAKIAYDGATFTLLEGTGSLPVPGFGWYLDNGGNISSSVTVPRAGNVLLDNSMLPVETAITSVVTYRRRLVVAQGSTVFMSDQNKPESWPTTNAITIPSGGPITALAVINFNTPTSSTTNELLVIFKERELWTITGNSFINLTDVNDNVYAASDISLLFVDYVGCVTQTLAVNANGFLFWVDYRGIYMWDGSNKPIYCSRLIESDFAFDGDIDLANLIYGSGQFLRRQNQIIWYLSDKDQGVNKLAYKLDMRLTAPNVEGALAGRILEAVFCKDTVTRSIYGMYSSLSGANEVLYAGDDEGYIWKLYDNFTGDGSTAINFTYRTRPLDMGSTGITKRFKSVVVWCQQSTLSDLRLNFWTGYQTTPTLTTTNYEAISQTVTNTLWDLGTWDVSLWDQAYLTYTPVVFNLNSSDYGTEGEALTLEFVQNEIESPVVIAGFSVVYSIIGPRSS